MKNGVNIFVVGMGLISMMSCCKRIQPQAESNATIVNEVKIEEKKAELPTEKVLWKVLSINESEKLGEQKGLTKFRLFELDSVTMRSLLSTVPTEKNRNENGKKVVISIPFPDGTLQSFDFFETVTMEPALLAKYPELKTYGGQGIDDPTSSGRFDFMPAGFHGFVLTQKGEIYIEPVSGKSGQYFSYFKHDVLIKDRKPFEVPKQK